MPRPRKPGRRPLNKGRTMEPSSICLPKSTWVTLDARAYERGMTRSALVRVFILEGLLALPKGEGREGQP